MFPFLLLETAHHISAVHVCNKGKRTRLQNLKLPSWSLSFLSSGSDGRSTRSSAADSQRREEISVKQRPHWGGLVIVKACPHAPVTGRWGGGEEAMRWDERRFVWLINDVLIAERQLFVAHGRKLCEAGRTWREGCANSDTTAVLYGPGAIRWRQYSIHYLGSINLAETYPERP